MQTESLAEKYKPYFKIGTEIGWRIPDTHAELLKKHFNSITCGNEMKYSSLCRRPGEYTFDRADKIVSFAKENGMVMHGHTFVWHNQTPDFIFENTDEEGLLATLRAHVEKVKEHFGELATFDAVNEAIEDKSDTYLRETKWKAILGDDYIPKVFRVIKEVLPNTALYYNDYNECVPEKREKIMRLLKEMLAEGAPISGMGMQFHVSIHRPSIDEIKRSIEAYASTGLTLRISEMDVSLYKDKEPQFSPLDPELLKKQADYYEQCFKVFREYHKHIDAVTFWGAADDVTWLNNFPVFGRKNWPLVFDDNHEPKEAFYRIMNF